MIAQTHRDRILVIDDKLNMLKLFCKMLESQYVVGACDDGARALGLFRESPFDVVVTDIRMPSMSGMEILAEVKRLRPSTEVILMTAYGEVRQAVEALKQGACDYVLKPFEPDEMLVVIEKALAHKRLLERAEFLQREVEQGYGLARIVGSSPAMQAVYALARKAIESDATILLLGESGTGKELFAKAIHYSGRRSRNRFVAINCGAIPKDLMESELFGHVKGAFSGATADKAGLFDEADGGTVFLDEISEFSQDLQIKINRAIQEREIRSVGGTRDRSVDVRIIAATNADLLDLARQGLFREDLYYRLNVFPIQIPPLRERRQDIPLLVEHFLAKYCRREGKRIRGLTPSALDLLMSYDWPGNVRELENAIERALILADGPTIGPEFFAQDAERKSLSDLPSPPLADLPYHEALNKITTDGLCEYFTGLLQKHRGNVTKAAAQAGIERESLHRLLRQYRIDPDQARK